MEKITIVSGNAKADLRPMHLKPGNYSNTVLLPIQDVVYFLEVHHVAYFVGSNQDAYYIVNWVEMNTTTHQFTSKHGVYLNWYSCELEKKELFTGTYLECYNEIKRLTDETLLVETKV